MNDNITLSLTQFAALLADTSDLAVKRLADELGLSKPLISKHKAYSMYGKMLIGG